MHQNFGHWFIFIYSDLKPNFCDNVYRVDHIINNFVCDHYACSISNAARTSVGIWQPIDGLGQGGFTNCIISYV